MWTNFIKKMTNITKNSLISAWIWILISTSVWAVDNKDIISKNKDAVSSILDTNFIVLKNPISSINEKIYINSTDGHISSSIDYQNMIKRRLDENKDIEKIENSLNLIYEYMKIWKDVSNEEQLVMKIYARNFHSEDINFMLWKFLIDTNWSAEYIRDYFLRCLNNWNKHRKEIEDIYFSKIFSYIKDDIKNIDEPFLASLILDFIPFMTKDFITNSWLPDSVIDNLLLIKEYKHNLAIIERSGKWHISIEFIEEHVMDLYRSNQNNVDINFIMWEYMLKHWLFPAKMRECFLKALKWWNKYSDIIHKIFLSRIIDVIKDDKDSINNESYWDTIETFMPYIRDDLARIGIVVAEK